VSCGVAMRVLTDYGKGVTVDSAEEAFIYGLLHDIGMIVFEQFLPREFELVNAACAERHIPRYVAEREVIGVDHAMIGARLAQKWKLPDNLVHVIAGHHDLEQCGDPLMRAMAARLAVADYMCTACGLGSHGSNAVVVSEEMWAVSTLTSRDIPKVLDEFFGSFPSIDELVQLAM
ncbi:MAG: hypothetical protein QG656_2214, partial [Candidatus Hydrogenedentes bacterium]|nr:hypothetical protein [Candidatus Hydrogenedentota bacterium]